MIPQQPAIEQIIANIPAGVYPTGFAPLTSDLLKNIIQRIVQGVKPEKIVLFGSYARGNPTPDSDLDILVIMHTQPRLTERVLAVSRCLRPRPVPMDILVRTPQEISLALGQQNTFIQEILQTGIVLYEQSKG